MYKQTVTYTDFDGVKKTEALYFNLTKAELTDMQVTSGGELMRRLKSIADAVGSSEQSSELSDKQQAEVYALFREIILKAYGEKVTDERGITRFKKSKALSDDFSTTEAFSELFMGFIAKPDTAVDFINSVIPVQATETASASAAM